MMRISSTNLGFLCAAALVLSSTGALAQTTFTNIADTSTGQFSEVANPAMNDSGTVAFRARLSTGEWGVYTGDVDTPPNTLITITVMGSEESLGRPAINSDGLVAVRRSNDPGGHDIVVGNGGPLTVIADPAGGLQLLLGWLGINDTGTVVFAGQPESGPGARGIYVGSVDTPANVIELVSDDATAYSTHFQPWINESGAIVFSVVVDGEFRIAQGHTDAPPNTTSLVPDTGPTESWSRVNDTGMMSFLATIDGVKGIYTSDGITATPLVTIGSDFSWLSSRPAINNSGGYSFVGVSSAGVGIFTGPDPVNDMVIGVGDPLFGSTVTNIGSDRYSLTESGQIAFDYELANGVKGVAVAVMETDVDTDGDGLLDTWETDGIPYTDADGNEWLYVLDIDGDGASDADPNHKDLFVELDMMNTLSFPQAAVDDVVGAFWAAPVPNPDGDEGITLHIVVDEDSIQFEEVSETPDDSWPTDAADLRSFYFGTVAEQFDPDSAALLEAKAKAYRYCILYNKASGGMGGLGEITEEGVGGDDFVIFAGGYSDENKAAVFMHELGHCLSLGHGGGDHVNGKPNYPSIMNYMHSYRET